MTKINLSQISTEQQNKRTTTIDQLSTLEMVKLINHEDQTVITAVSDASEAIATAIDAIYYALSHGGRLVYVGAGTSGRLGVLDASECLPTFGIGEEAIIAVIAGGDYALRHPIEGAEDNESAAHEDLKNINFTHNDILCAITSSGRTPYCLSALQYAASLHAKTISLACAQESIVSKLADYPIEAIVGEEVIMGSTRMKSGSAQKMILNMLSTGAMIKLGKVYQNLMVDLKATNEKLVERAKRMIMMTTHCDYERATELLINSHFQVKSAIVMEILNLPYPQANALLEKYNGRLSEVLLKK